MASTPAFVGAAAVATSSFTSASDTGRLTAARPASAPVVVRATAAPPTPIEFQTYSGGLDQNSQAPYSVTRYLFKPPPATLTEQEKDATVTAGLRQIFGNAYLMEEERAELYPAESEYRCGKITAKEFVRRCAKSATYKKRFFENVSQFRFFELNFKHLLGRAPLNQKEFSKHFQAFAVGGYDAEIDLYLDDEEYDTVFGEDYMPFTRFRGTYAPINQFNRMCTLEGGWAGSDKFKPQQLVTSLAANVPTAPHTIVDGLPPIPNSEHPSKKFVLPTASLERYRNEIEVAKAKALEVQVALEQAYANLKKARATIDPFKSMVADMDINPLYGKNFGSGVEVFSGQYLGAPAGGFGGSSGVGNIAGPSRGAARVIGKKEKQLEGLKQLIVDLERKVDVLAGERAAPAIQPEPIEFMLEGIEVPEFAAASAKFASESMSRFDETRTGTIDIGEDGYEDGAVVVGGTAVVGGSTVVGTAPVFVGGKLVDGTGTVVDSGVTVRLPVKEGDEEDDEEEIFTASPVVISTRRRADDDMLGPNPGVLIEELEEARIASGKEFMAGLGTEIKFPGDGSEMNIGG